MPLFLSLERTRSSWAKHVNSFEKLYAFHSLKTGSPEDFLQLGPKLASSEGFRLDFSDLVRRVRDREGGKLSAGEMLTIVGVAIGGQGVARAEMELVDAAGMVQILLAGVGGWRDAGGGATLGEVDDAVGFEQRREPGELYRGQEEKSGGFRAAEASSRAGEPRLPRESSGGGSDASPEMRETLARLEMASMQLKIYLDDIDRRIGRIEPSLEDLTAAMHSSAEFLHGRGAGEGGGAKGGSLWGNAALAAALPDRSNDWTSPHEVKKQTGSPADEGQRPAPAALHEQERSEAVTPHLPEQKVVIGEAALAPSAPELAPARAANGQIAVAQEPSVEPPLVAIPKESPKVLTAAASVEEARAAEVADIGRVVPEAVPKSEESETIAVPVLRKTVIAAQKPMAAPESRSAVAAPVQEVQLKPVLFDDTQREQKRQPVVEEGPRRRRTWIWAAVLLVLAGAGAAAFVFRASPLLGGTVQGVGDGAAGGGTKVGGDAGSVGNGVTAPAGNGSETAAEETSGTAEKAAAPTTGRKAGAGKKLGGGVAAQEVGPGPATTVRPDDVPSGAATATVAPAASGTTSPVRAVSPPATTPAPGTAETPSNGAASSPGVRDRVEGARAAEIVRPPTTEDLQPAATGASSGATMQKTALVASREPVAPGPSPSGLSSSGGDVPRPAAGRTGLSTVTSGGMVVKSPAPTYPAQARQLRLEGKVTVRATVDGTGRVTDAQVLTGPGVFFQSALDAVRHRRYEPFLVGGTPTSFQTIVTLNYRLEH